MIKICGHVSLAGPNEMRIHEEIQVKSTKRCEGQEQMMNIFDNIFEEIGKIYDKKNDTEILGKSHINWRWYLLLKNRNKSHIIYKHLLKCGWMKESTETCLRKFPMMNRSPECGSSYT